MFAEVEINTITLIAGLNSTGKSTVGKVLYSIFNSFYNIEETSIQTIKGLITRYIEDKFFGYDSMRLKVDRCVTELLTRRNIAKKEDIKEIIMMYLGSAFFSDQTDDSYYNNIVDLLNISTDEIYRNLLENKLHGEFEDQKKLEDIGVAATLHDIGKVGIPDEILNKPGKLNDEEFNKIKDHVTIGNQLLENTSSDKISDDVLQYAKEITLHHHEKYDGTGYPDGLKEDGINIISRIMAVIDVYDALVNDRVYKKAISYDEAEQYIISQSGKAFDPKAVNIFMNVKKQLKEINEKYKEN